MVLKLRLKELQCESKGMFFLIIILAVLSNASSAQIKEVFIPVTMSIDGEYYPSSLLMQCKLEDLQGIKQQDFKGGEDLAKKDFEELLKSVKNNDKESFRARGENFRAQKYDSERIQKADRNLSVLNRLMRIYEEKGTGLKIYKNVLLGNNGIFIFGSDRKVKSEVFPSRISCYYEKLQPNIIRWNIFEDTLDPLSAIITDSFDKAADNPTWFGQTVIKKPESRFKVMIPGTEGENPAYFLFDGKIYNVDVMSEDVHEDTNSVIYFYQRAYQVWRDISSEEFAEFYTQKSKARLLRSMKPDPTLIENYRRTSTLTRKVIFILDAHPFYVLFSKVGNKARLLHEYIVVDPSDGTFKLTNLSRLDLTSQYFQNDDFYSVLNTVDSKSFPMKETSK